MEKISEKRGNNLSDVPDEYQKCKNCGFYHNEDEECPTQEEYE